MSHVFINPDLIELDRIWPLGQKLIVPERGIIVVAGAYQGRYMHYLHDLFPTALIRGYEPQIDAVLKAKESFKDTEGVKIVNAGLATASRKAALGNYGSDGASALEPGNSYAWSDMHDIVQVVCDMGTIDLFVMNLEGSEWALIPHLLDELMHHRIASMAIQFHEKYVSKQRRDYVLDYLDQYYDRAYWDYPTWCYFLRKN